MLPASLLVALGRVSKHNTHVLHAANSVAWEALWHLSSSVHTRVIIFF